MLLMAPCGGRSRKIQPVMHARPTACTHAHTHRNTNYWRHVRQTIYCL